MDPVLSTIIIAIITGIFSVITVVIQKRQDRVIKKIDQQTMFIEKEKGLKQQMLDKEREASMIKNEIILLILNTNIDILKTANDIDESTIKLTTELNERFTKVMEEIHELEKQYRVVLDMTAEFQKNSDKKK